VLFSAVNVVEPGTFDLNHMEDFKTPGICMFLRLPGPKRSLHAFEQLVESARKIANMLGAELKDENHSVLTQQTIEHYRQRVLDFERKMLSHRAR
jgi:cell division protein ZipA